MSCTIRSPYIVGWMFTVLLILNLLHFVFRLIKASLANSLHLRLLLVNYLETTINVDLSLQNSRAQVEVTPWVSSKHNMGFAFNRSTWREIVACTKMFCTYDDYNWDWSLQHVSQQCMKHKLHAMVVKGPRVFHIGEW